YPCPEPATPVVLLLRRARSPAGVELRVGRSSSPSDGSTTRRYARPCTASRAHCSRCCVRRDAVQFAQALRVQPYDHHGPGAHMQLRMPIERTCAHTGESLPRSQPPQCTTKLRACASGGLSEEQENVLRPFDRFLLAHRAPSAGSH